MWGWHAKKYANKVDRDEIIVKVNLPSPIPTSFYITVAN